MKQRLFHLLCGVGILLAAGLAYGLFALATGLSIPCPLHLVTGFSCPGCGVTRMCLALMRLDFAAAWGYNPGLMAVVPFLGVLAVRMGFVYVQTGRRKPAGWESRLLWAIVGWLLVWGVVRNGL